VDVIDLDIEVNANLRVFRFRHSLKGQPRPVTKA